MRNRKFLRLSNEEIDRFNFLSQHNIFESYNSSHDDHGYYFINEGLIKSYSVNSCKRYLMKRFDCVKDVLDNNYWLNRGDRFLHVFELFNQLPDFTVLLKNDTKSVVELNETIFNLCGWSPAFVTVEFWENNKINYSVFEYNDGLFEDDEITILNQTNSIDRDIFEFRQCKENAHSIWLSYFAKFGNNYRFSNEFSFHVSPVKNFYKIAENGLCVKNQKHKLLDRLYFSENTYVIKKLLTNVLKESYFLIRVRNDAFDVNTFADEMHNGCFYSLSCISPYFLQCYCSDKMWKNISEISSVDDLFLLPSDK